MLKPIFTCFLAIETAMLQIYLKTCQNVLKKNFLAYTIQDARNIDKPVPKNSFVSHRDFEAVQFSDKQKSLRNGSFKFSNKPTEATC